jgi:hypothetical protein
LPKPRITQSDLIVFLIGYGVMSLATSELLALLAV